MALLYSEQLPMGWEAAAFDLVGTDNKSYSLKDFTDRKGLLVIFTCNHCPYAKAAWPLITKLHGKYGSDIAFVAINPNDYESYPDDAPDAMKEKMTEWNIQFPYLVDDTQDVAKLYKAQCTPDPYLFRIEDGICKLFYHGRINDNWQEPENVKEQNLEGAINKLLVGEDSPQTQPPSMGCSIKWKS